MHNKTVLWRLFSRILHLVVSFSPGTITLRPFLHRMRNVKISLRVFIGEEVYLENDYPECIEIQDEVVIALRATLGAHLKGPGKIIVQKKTWIGSGCIIAAAGGQTLTIGEGAALAAGSVVTKDVPPYTLMGGIPAKPIARITVPLTLDTSYTDF
jgi:acetyltransferase-like isoleucine patch superfamily enzyme